MKQNKKLLIFSFLLFSPLSLNLASCTKEVVQEPLSLTGETTVYIGGSFQYKANREGVIFKVNDDSLGVISNKGVLTPLKKGKIIVSASPGEEKAELEVTIYPEKDYKTYALEVTALPTRVTYNTGDTFDSKGRKVNLVTYTEGKVTSSLETTNYKTDYDGKKFTQGGDITITVSPKTQVSKAASATFTVKVNDTFKSFKDQVISLRTRENYSLEFSAGKLSYIAKYTKEGFSQGIFNKDGSYIDSSSANGTMNNRVFLNSEGVLSASFYRENNVLRHEVTSDFYVDVSTGKKYQPSSLYEVSSFDFRPKVDKDRLSNTRSSDDTSYSFSASVLSSFFLNLGFTEEDILASSLSSSKELKSDSHTYLLNQLYTIKVFDIGKTEIKELKDCRNTRKGVNQFSNLIHFMDYVKLESEKSYSLDDFPVLDGAYNYSLSQNSTTDTGRSLIGQAASNPIPDYDRKRESLSFIPRLKLDDYLGLYIHQYISPDYVWQFSVRYDSQDNLVSFSVFYYQGTAGSALSRDKYHELLSQRLSLTLSATTRMDGFYDKLSFFTSRVLSDKVLSKVDYRQLKDQSGNNLLQIETEVEDEKTAKAGTESIQNYLERNAFTKSEETDSDNNIYYLYSKEIDGKTLTVEAGYQQDSSNRIPVYKLIVLFQD